MQNTTQDVQTKAPGCTPNGTAWGVLAASEASAAAAAAAAVAPVEAKQAGEASRAHYVLLLCLLNYLLLYILHGVGGALERNNNSGNGNQKKREFLRRRKCWDTPSIATCYGFFCYFQDVM